MLGAQLVTGAEFCAHSGTLRVYLVIPSAVVAGLRGYPVLHVQPPLKTQPGRCRNLNAMVSDSTWFQQAGVLVTRLFIRLCQPLVSFRG